MIIRRHHCRSRWAHYLLDNVQNQSLVHRQQVPLKPPETSGWALRVSSQQNGPSFGLDSCYVGGLFVFSTTGVPRWTCHHMPFGNVAPTQQLRRPPHKIFLTPRNAPAGPADERQTVHWRTARIHYWMTQRCVMYSHLSQHDKYCNDWDWLLLCE